MPARPRLLPDGAGPDAARVLLTRGMRGFADGFVSVLLPVHLAALGFGGAAIGGIASVTLAGSALATRALSTAWAAGHVPAAHNAHALWFTITGVLTVLAAVACAALLHTARTEPSYDRVQALRPPFATLSLLWLVISFVFLAG